MYIRYYYIIVQVLKKVQSRKWHHINIPIIQLYPTELLDKNQNYKD